MGEAPIDLDALKAAAERTTTHPVLGDGELVTRRYLRSIEQELRAGRAAQAELARLKVAA